MSSEARHHLYRRRRRRPVSPAARVGPFLRTAAPALDPFMVGAIVLLASLGILNLYAIGDKSMALHQGLAVVIGLAVMVWAWRTPSSYWPWLGRAAYAISVLLLLAVAAHGVDAYGAKRWLAIGSFILQPSELAELGLLLVLAEVMSHRELRERRRVGLALGLAIPPIGLTLLEPDLSTAGLLGVILVACLVLGRVRFKVLAGLALTGLIALPIGLTLLRPYQLARLHSFLSGSDSSLGGNWTLLQAHIAIASGGLLGIGHSTLGRLLTSYLPARETDLAFASLVEQFGLVAGAVAILAVLILIWRLVAAASSSRTLLGSLIAGIMAALLGAEVVLSVGGNLGVLPLAGVPIPLLAYGGTVSVAHLAAFGMILGSRLDAKRRRLWRFPALLPRRPRLVRTVAAGLACSLILLGGLTWQLQSLHKSSLKQAAVTEVTRWIPLAPERGLIEDRHGVALAANTGYDQVLAVPQLVKTSRLPKLAELLGQTKPQLKKELAQPTHGTFTVSLTKNLPVAGAGKLKSAAITGILIEPVEGRVYPYGSLLGPILGYTGEETSQDVKTLGLLPPGAGLGQAGLELEYNKDLTGKYGSQAILVNEAGVPIAMGRTIPPVNGGNLITSLDLNLQKEATEMLEKAISGAYSGSQVGNEGSVVVMDPQNGQVLAMASWPAYNDNIFESPRDNAAIKALLTAPGNPLLEHATQTAMPPGSNFKLVVSSADVADDAIPPSEVIPTGYSFTYDGHTFDNWESLPPQDLSEAIADSNDVYFYKLAVALGAERLLAVAHTMGAGQLTGIDLPGESPGYLGTPASVAKEGETWYPGSTVILGIGQGYVTATPVQDAVWTGEAGTGKKVTPRIGLSVSTSATAPSKPISAPAPETLPWASKLAPVQDGLRLAVTASYGTAVTLDSLGVDAGGKTGTAQDPTAPNGGPDAWFTALAPMSSPQVVVDLLVRGGGQGYYDQPAVTSIMKYFFDNEKTITSTLPQQSAATTATPSPTLNVSRVVADTPTGAALALAHFPGAQGPRLSSSPGGN